MSPSPVYREACDDCHFRKIRCITANEGGCLPCHHNSRTCVFSPRQKMGRPKRRRTVSISVDELNINPTVDPSRTSIETSRPTMVSVPTTREPVHVQAHIENLFAPEGWQHDQWPWSVGLSKDQSDISDLFRDSLQTNESSMDHTVDLRMGMNADYSNYGNVCGEMTEAQSMESHSINPSPIDENIFITQPPLLQPIPIDAMVGKVNQMSSNNEHEIDTGICLNLSNLQFNLHRQESQLSDAEQYLTDLAQVRGLDVMLQTVGGLCDVVRELFNAENSQSSNSPSKAGHTNPAMYVMVATTALKALDVYEILIRVARRHAVRTTPSTPTNAYDSMSPVSRPQSRLPSLNLSSSSVSSTNSTSSMVLDSRRLSGTIEPGSSTPTTITGVGTFRPCPELNQIMILTAMDFHLSFFDSAFNRLQQYTSVLDTMSYLTESNTKISDMRTDIQNLFRSSRDFGS